MHNPRRKPSRLSSRLRTISGLTGLLMTASLPAHASFSLSGTDWEQLAAEQQLDPLLLYAVALAESARKRGKGQIAPWAWTLNERGKGLYFTSRDEAASHLDQAIRSTSNVDVGIMQVNIRWNGHRVDDPRSLLDPRTNLRVGATILREALDSAPDDRVLGVGRYHSSDPSRARRYGERVLTIYRQLAKLVTFPE